MSNEMKVEERKKKTYFSFSGWKILKKKIFCCFFLSFLKKGCFKYHVGLQGKMRTVEGEGFSIKNKMASFFLSNYYSFSLVPKNKNKKKRGKGNVRKKKGDVAIIFLSYSLTKKKIKNNELFCVVLQGIPFWSFTFPDHPYLLGKEVT